MINLFRSCNIVFVSPWCISRAIFLFVFSCPRPSLFEKKQTSYFWVSISPSSCNLKISIPLRSEIVSVKMKSKLCILQCRLRRRFARTFCAMKMYKSVFFDFFSEHIRECRTRFVLVPRTILHVRLLSRLRKLFLSPIHSFRVAQVLLSFRKDFMVHKTARLTTKTRYLHDAHLFRTTDKALAMVNRGY